MKQIDNNFEGFFREQFEDFESAPNVDSWQLIQERLQTKRRRIALWWWIPTGIAAVLVGFLCIKSFSNNNERATKNIVKIENTSKKDTFIQPKTNAKEVGEKIENITNTIEINAKNSTINKSVKSILPQKSTIHYEETHISNEQTVYHEVPNIENSTPNISSSSVKVEEVMKPKNIKFFGITMLPTLRRQVFSNEEVKVKIPMSVAIVEKNTLLKKKFKPSIIASVNAAPTYNFRNISPNKNDENYINKIISPAITSTQRIGLQIGSDIDFKLTKRLGFATLFNYQYTPFSVAYDLRRNETPTIDALVTNKGNSLNINSVSYETSREIITQNWHSLNAALAFNFYSNEKNKWSVGIGTGKWLGKDKPLGTPIFTTLGYTHTFKNGLKLAPFFRYDLKNYTLNNKILEVQPYQFGLKIQL